MIRIYPQIGENGRLYFNYNLGAKFLCAEMHLAAPAGERLSRFVYAVERCEYIGGREYYYISRDGRPLVSPFTVNRLHYVLHFTQIDELTAGVRQELPLTAEEVSIYFTARKAWFEEQRAQARRVLEAMPEYKALTDRQKQLNFKIGSAEALGEGVGALIGELKAVEDKIKALYSGAGINAAYLNAQKVCPKCGGRGLTEYGEPCGCALRIEEKIKDYCARLRRSEREARGK